MRYQQIEMFPIMTRREAALDRVLRRSGEWRGQFRIALAALSMATDEGVSFTADELFSQLEPRIGAPHDQRAWPGAIKDGLRRGALVKATKHNRKNQRYGLVRA